MRIKLKNGIIKEISTARILPVMQTESESPGQVVFQFKTQHSVKLLWEYLTYFGTESIRAIDDYESIYLSYFEKEISLMDAQKDAQMRLNQLFIKGYVDVSDLTVIDDEGVIPTEAEDLGNTDLFV